MRRTAVWLPLLLVGCSCEHRNPSDSSSEFECCDTNWDTDLDWLDQDLQDTNSDPEALDCDSEDPAIDPSEDALPDPITADCQELDQDPEELESLVLSPLPASGRTPMNCGPGCRQVSFADDSLYYHSYEVWGKYLAFNTQRRTASSFRSTEYLLDLDTLAHYKIAEDEWEWATSIAKPGNGWVTLHNSLLQYVRFETVDADTNYSTLFQFNVSSDPDVHTSRLMSQAFDAEGGLDRLDLFNNMVAYTDFRGPSVGSAVYVLNSNTRTTCRASIPGYSADEPAIWGDYVVFHQYGTGTYGGLQIYLYDIATAVTTQLTNHPWDRFGPAIWENRVAWTDCRNGCTILDELVSDVYMMDLTTGEETPVCTDPAAQPGPLTIWGDRIAWMDCRNDPEYPDYCGSAYGTRMDIYVYDIPTGTEWLSTDFPGMKMNPFLYEDRLYFVMLDNDGVYSIFEMTLS